MTRSLRLPALLLLTAAAVASAQAVRENVRVGLQSIRLDVRGRDGKPLPDLKAADVKLRVDGKDVPIEGLDAIAAARPSGAVATSIAPPSDKPAPASAAGAIDAGAASSSDLYLAIFFDETSSNAYDRRDMFRQLESFLKNGTAAGVHVLLERFNGTLHPEGAWTTDAATAVANLKKMQKKVSDAHVPSPSEIGDEIRNGRKGRDVEMQVDLSGRRTMDGLMQALIRFPEVPGRKGLAFITDGTPLMTPFDLSIMLGSTDTTSQNDRAARAEYLKNHDEAAAAKQIEMQLESESLATFAEAASNQSTWAQRVAKITNKAVELDIAFYPIDSEAVDRGTNPGLGSKWPGRAMPGVAGVGKASSSGMTARVSVAQTMTVLADTTGGQPLLAPLQASDRLGAIASERGSGYLVTFRDPSPNDNRYHKVEISIDRPGTKVAYRHGYRVRGDDERTLDAIVAHLQESTSDNPLNLRASFEILRKEGNRDIVQMKLAYTPTEAPGDQAHERPVQVWAICSDDNGNRAAPIVRKSMAQRLGTAEGAFADSLQMGLPPGPYTWSVALKDVSTNVTSYFVVRKEL